MKPRYSFQINFVRSIIYYLLKIIFKIHFTRSNNRWFEHQFPYMLKGIYNLLNKKKIFIKLQSTSTWIFISNKLLTTSPLLDQIIDNLNVIFHTNKLNVKFTIYQTEIFFLMYNQQYSIHSFQILYVHSCICTYNRL